MPGQLVEEAELGPLRARLRVVGLLLALGRAANPRHRAACLVLSRPAGLAKQACDKSLLQQVRPALPSVLSARGRGSPACSRAKKGGDEPRGGSMFGSPRKKKVVQPRGDNNAGVV